MCQALFNLIALAFIMTTSALKHNLHFPFEIDLAGAFLAILRIVSSGERSRELV